MEIDETLNSDFSSVSKIADEEHTPKLFSDEQAQDSIEQKETEMDSASEQLFDQDNSEEEDFEIPAFLRRQKF